MAACLLPALAAAAARAQVVSPDFYITNGQVTTEALRGGTLYVGGSFTYVGPITGAGVTVDAATAAATPGFPRVNGTVMAAVPDGAGGWYIGGSFTAVGSSPRANLAHVLSDRSVAAWDPGTNGAVRVLLLRAGLLYVGGDFTTLGGPTRNRIGAVDAGTGATAAWNPNANSSLRAFADAGSVLYVGGQFTTIGGQARNRIAALDWATGAADPAWNPNANSFVLALAYDAAGGVLYAGGQFTSMGGQARNRAAAIDPATGFVTSWNPNANNPVLALLVDGGVVYAGGQFTVIGGQARGRIAALDPGTALATAWNPGAANQVLALARSGTTLYAGGDFLSIGGQSRSRVAALDAATGLATPWNPSAFGTVSVVVPSGGAVFVGGSFNGIGGVPRNNLAAFDTRTGVVTGWDPNANNQVQALLAAPDRLYAGGNFTQVGGRIRNNIAALDLGNGQALGWDPDCDGQVSALALSPAGDRVYAGGLFATIGGQPRENFAALDAGTGLAEAWSADADDQVFAIDASRPTVYVGGNFTTLGGEPRNFIGAVDAATGAVSPWAPDASGTVRAITARCDQAYVAGFFTMIGGQPRNRAASLDLDTGQALAWDPNANGPVFAMHVGPGAVYLGGVLSTVGTQTRNRAAAVDPVTGAVLPWDPNSNGTVRALVGDTTAVYVGGVFSFMDGVPTGNLSQLTPENSVPCPAITLSSPPLAAAVAGAAYSQALAASGGSAPWCWSVTSGALPAGLSLDPASGLLSGTPAGAGVAVFAVTATDARGCTGTAAYTLTVTAAPATNGVVADGSGLCLNPARTTVGVPFVLTRGDATGLRAVSVTFQIETSKLRLAGTPGGSVHLGSWADTFPNRSLEVADLGSGRYTVDVVLLGAPCGATGGGTLFTADVAAQGPTGSGSVTVTSVLARDCANGPVGMSPGAPGSVSVSSATIALSPATLPDGVTGAPYSQAIAASGGSGPLAFSVSSGEPPPGLTLSPAGLLGGTPTQGGTFAFTVTATEADGCSGSQPYSITMTCPALALSPAFLPDGAVGAPYDVTLGAAGGLAPLAFTLASGTLPPGLTLSPAGELGGTPTATGTAVFALAVTDAAGCAGSRGYTVDVFAAPPVSSIAAATAGLAISSAHPCVSVPFVYTRGESAPVRALSVSFQFDPAQLAFCGSPAASIHPGSWLAAFPNSQLLVTDDGGGAWTVDLALLGEPCGIATGGTLFTVDFTSAGADGSAGIVVTRTKARDCGNAAVGVGPGAPGSLRIQNTPIALAPPTLPNALVGAAYSQAITAESGVPPFTYSVSAGSLPPGLSLSPAGLLAGTPSAVGSFAFTVSVADTDGVPGSRAYTLSVACPVIAISPGTLADARLGAPYAQTLAASGGTAPYAFTVTGGALPAGLSLSAAGELTGTPTATGASVFQVTAVDTFACAGTEVYTLPVFVDPAISRIAASTTGQCLSANRACVSVPFVYQRGDTVPAMAAHVTFQLDPRFALCTPASPLASIHAGTWLSAFPNRAFQVLDNGGGSYTVDQSLLGQPCGPDSGGVLFTVDVAAAGPDGAGDLTVTECHVRDCAGQPLPAEPGPAAQLVVSHARPPAIADLASAQLASGNGTSGLTGIAVTFTPPAAGSVALYRAPFGSYPEYDDLGGAPPDSTLAPDAPWTLVSAAATPGLVDHPPVRGSWHYVAFLTDSCGNRSDASNVSAGSLDYHLGDVSNGLARGQGDNRVNGADLSLLGAHYGIGGAAIAADSVAYLDVGPTLDGLATSRPVTDDVIDFEDLMVFSLDFQAVSGPAAAARPAPPPAKGAPGEAFELLAPAIVAPGEEASAVLRLAAAGGMQGFSAQLAWDPAVVRPTGVESGGFLEAQGGVLLSPRPGAADAALLGVRGTGIAGSGEVARFRFEVLREGEPKLRLASVVARDAANRALAPAGLARSVVDAIPTRTLLLSPAPNPARGATTLAFALARRGDVELAIYSVDGRRVRTLARGPREPGAWRVAWNGADDQGRGQAPGVYWARLRADGASYSRRIVFLK